MKILHESSFRSPSDDHKEYAVRVLTELEQEQAGNLNGISPQGLGRHCEQIDYVRVASDDILLEIYKPHEPDWRKQFYLNMLFDHCGHAKTASTGGEIVLAGNFID